MTVTFKLEPTGDADTIRCISDGGTEIVVDTRSHTSRMVAIAAFIRAIHSLRKK